MSDTKQIAEWALELGFVTLSTCDLWHVRFMGTYVNAVHFSPFYESAMRDKARIAELESRLSTPCKCTLAQSVAGDGCDVCNPAKALDYAYQTIDDLKEELTEAEKRIAELEAALRLFVTAERGHGWRDCAPDTQERIAIDAAIKALKGEAP